ncbi:hypothetical protein D9M72_537020 [compost metagenome]
MGEQSIGDAPRKLSRPARIVGRDAFRQRCKQSYTRIGMVLLCRPYRGDRRLECRPLATVGGPGIGERRDFAPVIGARRMYEQKLIYACDLVSHRVLPTRFQTDYPPRSVFAAAHCR